MRISKVQLLAILSLLVLCGVALGLVTQFKHVGFIASCFIAGIAAGWWFQRRRLMAASVTALLVFTATYLACWVQMGYASTMHRGPLSGHQDDVHIIGEAVSAYVEKTGNLPESLRDLETLEDRNLRHAGQRLDLWGNPIHYQKTANGFELASLGKDGRIGGAGLDADEFLDSGKEHRESRLPLSQFLFETQGSGAIFRVALVASLVAASIWLIPPKGEQFTVRKLVAPFAVTTISAVVVAVLLAVLHVTLMNSGH